MGNQLCCDDTARVNGALEQYKLDSEKKKLEEKNQKTHVNQAEGSSVAQAKIQAKVEAQASNEKQMRALAQSKVQEYVVEQRAIQYPYAEVPIVEEVPIVVYHPPKSEIKQQPLPYQQTNIPGEEYVKAAQPAHKTQVKETASAVIVSEFPKEVQEKKESIVQVYTEIQANKQPYSQKQSASSKQPQLQPRIQSQTQPKQLPWKVVEQAPQQIIRIPELTPKVEKTLINPGNKHLATFLSKQELDHPIIKVKKYGGDVYVGNLDKEGRRPQGFGKMYKQDHSLYVGYFSHGKASGIGAYIFADGSYYFGKFVNNQAQTQQGEYKSQAFQYEGGFKQNAFEGNGYEKGEGYEFNGEFRRGSRVKGTLKWNNCKYTGTFNANKQFHNRGVLEEPQGVYQGQFENGQKEGDGVYKYSNGSKYEGTYRRGRREGKGTIYLKDNQIYYRGEMKNGMPHGKGQVSKDGKMVSATFVEGIQSNLLPV